jgi:hypothetical protein
MKQKFATNYLDEKFDFSPDHNTDDHDKTEPQRGHAPKGDPDTRGNRAPEGDPQGDHENQGNHDSNDGASQDDHSRENDQDHDLDDETIDS